MSLQLLDRELTWTLLKYFTTLATQRVQLVRLVNDVHRIFPDSQWSLSRLKMTGWKTSSGTSSFTWKYFQNLWDLSSLSLAHHQRASLYYKKSELVEFFNFSWLKLLSAGFYLTGFSATKYCVQFTSRNPKRKSKIHNSRILIIPFSELRCFKKVVRKSSISNVSLHLETLKF